MKQPVIMIIAADCLLSTIVTLSEFEANDYVVENMVVMEASAEPSVVYQIREAMFGLKQMVYVVPKGMENVKVPDGALILVCDLSNNANLYLLTLF